MTTRILTSQKPPVKKQVRLQRRDWRENPVNGIEWANWLDAFLTDPILGSVSPNALLATDGPTVITVTGSGFGPGSVIEFNGVPAPGGTTYVNGGTLTASFDPSVAGSIQVTVRNAGDEESGDGFITVT